MYALIVEIQLCQLANYVYKDNPLIRHKTGKGEPATRALILLAVLLCTTGLHDSNIMETTPFLYVTEQVIYRCHI